MSALSNKLNAIIKAGQALPTASEMHFTSRHNGEDSDGIRYIWAKKPAEGTVLTEGNQMALERFNITKYYFPGNCGIAVLAYMQVHYAITSADATYALSEIIMQIVKRNDCALLIYTTSEHQQTEVAVLDACGFTPGRTMRNPNSQNNIQVWQLDLSRP